MGIDGTLKKAVFLDRDGVINRAILREGRPYPPDVLADVTILPGVDMAIEALKAAGYLLVVVTNQPDVARGTQARSVVEAINNNLRTALGLEHFQVCYHDDRDDCPCRKPKPGLILDAAARYRIDLRRSFVVGDRWRDIAAGQAAGCRTIWIDYGYAEREPSGESQRVGSLLHAARWILAQ